MQGTPIPPPEAPEGSASETDAENHAARLDRVRLPLVWTTEKLGQGVNVSADGATASRQASGWSAQLGNEWMQGGRHPRIYTVALVLDNVLPETTIGIVGRNFFPSDWCEPLRASRHAIVVECGSGRFSVKGKSTSFVMRPLTNGARLQLTLDMQLQELTVELLGDGPGVITSSLTVEGIPAEVALCVGFCAGGPQSVRIIGCTSEKPEMLLLGKLQKDLWDEDNRIEPLPLNAKKERGMLQQQQNIAKMAAQLGL